jgi:hypothetical protein
MTKIASQVELGAPAARIWDVLVDFDSYADWNPYITAVATRTAVRTQLVLRTRLPGGRSTRARANLLTLEPGRRLSWRGFRVAPGVLEREHVLELAPLETGRVAVRHSVRVTGLLGPLLARAQRTKAGLDRMNEALKHRVEARPDERRAPRAA